MLYLTIKGHLRPSDFAADYRGLGTEIALCPNVDIARPTGNRR